MVNKDYAHKFKVGSSAEMSFQKFGTKLLTYQELYYNKWILHGNILKLKVV